MKRNHRELRVWQDAMALVEHLYTVTRTFPQAEIYGLTSQIRRAAVSVPANIAEGAARSSSREPRQFLSIAQGSLSELDTLIDLSARLGYVRDGASILDRVGRVNGLLSKLRSSIKAAD
ncbi:MAG TPA: four helix bundle protein [Burkholderiales bacterium]|nr:four helix bundle protein [Burkholderiales bacterium]